jgi:hypothetical protein
MQCIDLVIALKKCKSFMKQKNRRIIALTLVEAAIAKNLGNPCHESIDVVIAVAETARALENPCH